MLLMALLAVSCTDDNIVSEENERTEQVKGDIVQFMSGTVEGSTTTRAEVRYYMPIDYRFVCRMYYKPSKTSSTNSENEPFDVEYGTDQIAWLKVGDNSGSSFYRTNLYNEPAPSDLNAGNDPNAQTFYWQNRKEHAFLAWTDLNKARTIKGGTHAGDLKFGADVTYVLHTNNKTEKWVPVSYEINGVEPDVETFESISQVYDYASNHATELNSTSAPSGVDISKARFSFDKNDKSLWEKGLYYSLSNSFVSFDEARGVEEWYVCKLFTQKKIYQGTPSSSAIETFRGRKYVMEGGVPVALAEEIPAANEGDPSTYKYWECDYEGYVVYDETTSVVFCYSISKEKKTVEDTQEFPALAFDLTKPTGNNKSILDQPDICQALKIQKPISAGDRVNLYFEHKFSQIQVNIKSSADNSVSITAGNILKVELLGVTEEGYIFTELNERGEVRPASYKEVDTTDPVKFPNEILDKNEWGTSFDMFLMPEAETGYLKSYNAIAFGQLQAIRITWTEDPTNVNAVQHESTFKIPDISLINLKSGIRYIWNMELRRGTLALLKTEIIDWIVPANELEHSGIDGTIDE